MPIPNIFLLPVILSSLGLLAFCLLSTLHLCQSCGLYNTHKKTGERRERIQKARLCLKEASYIRRHRERDESNIIFTRTQDILIEKSSETLPNLVSKPPEDSIPVKSVRFAPQGSPDLV